MTLIDILLVVVILGILAAMVIPIYTRRSDEACAAVFVTNLRTACAAFHAYFATHGTYPPDAAPAVVPPGMADLLRPLKWAEPTPVGGKWEWDYLQPQSGFSAGVSVHKPAWSDAKMAEIDELLDDGNLATGCFRKRQDGYIYGWEP